MTEPIGTPEELARTLLELEAHGDADFRRRALYELLRTRVTGHRLLDVGAGAGAISFRLAAEGFDVVALEPATALLEAMRSAARSRQVRLDARPLGVHELDTLGEERFDTVLCLDVIEHVEDDVGALRALGGRLAPGGRLLLTVPAGRRLYGERDRAIGHFRRYGLDELREKFGAAGLALDELRYWNLIGVAPYAIFEKLLRRPIADAIRRGPRTPARRVLGEALYRWLQLESHVAPPVGLTLLAVARRVGG